MSLTLSTTRQITISLLLTDNRRVRGLKGKRSIPRNARRSTTEAIEPRKLITPLIHDATLGTGVTSARRSTPSICSALRATSHSRSEKTRYCSPTTTASACTFGSSPGEMTFPGKLRILLCDYFPRSDRGDVFLTLQLIYCRLRESLCIALHHLKAPKFTRVAEHCLAVHPH